MIGVYHTSKVQQTPTSLTLIETAGTHNPAHEPRDIANHTQAKQWRHAQAAHTHISFRSTRGQHPRSRSEATHCFRRTILPDLWHKRNSRKATVVGISTPGPPAVVVASTKLGVWWWWCQQLLDGNDLAHTARHGLWNRVHGHDRVDKVASGRHTVLVHVMHLLRTPLHRRSRTAPAQTDVHLRPLDGTLHAAVLQKKRNNNNNKQNTEETKVRYTNHDTTPMMGQMKPTTHTTPQHTVP